MNFSYHAYGLHLESSIQLDALSNFDARAGTLPRVSIIQGQVETTFPSATEEKPVVFDASAGNFYCHVLGAGRYSVTSDTIVIDRENRFDEGLLNTFLYGVVLASAAYLNQRLPLHASAIGYGSSVVAFCGDSGAGKSTTAAIFEDAGYPLVTDDILALAQNEDGSFHCYPGPPFSKLNQASMELTNRTTENQEYLIDKYHLYSRNWSSESEHALSSIFTIETDSEVEDLRITPLKGIEKIQAIFRYLYRNYWVSSFGLAETVNRQVMALAPRVSVFKIQRPSDKVTEPQELRDRILEQLATEALA